MSELSASLSRKSARDAADKPRRRHLPVARLAFAGILIVVAVVSLRVLLVETPEGGRPTLTVNINDTQKANPIVGANALPRETAPLEIGPEIPAEDLGEATIADTATPLVPEPDAMGNLPGMTEETTYGPLPRISPAGVTPFDAYARPSVSLAGAGGRPLVAIIVTGLGLNLTGTLDSIEQLPENVTLAFAPYGKTLDRSVGAARAEGHEILLEVPLEPFDYPENDPGPETLLTGQAPRDNMEKLYAVMARIGGYVGLINNMGARFTASAADFAPMMEELGARGLGYVDDGTSNRSLAPQLAQANRVPFRRADLTLDHNPARAPILDALAQLEAQARRNGAAIGIASALPVSVQTIAEWVRDAESRGLLVVPASAVMQ